jgi:prepilin-type N-terminal cleavage/methylation domain-containing protein
LGFVARKTSANEGFSLIELLIVVAIILIVPQSFPTCSGHIAARISAVSSIRPSSAPSHLSVSLTRSALRTLAQLDRAALALCSGPTRPAA